MREYDRGLRSAVHTILHRYTRYDGKPFVLERSHRVLTLFVGLRTESFNSFRRCQPPIPDLTATTPRILVFASVATEAGFRHRMIDQIERYLKLKQNGLTPEWEAFGRRNHAEIERLSPLITLAQSCAYREVS